MTIGNDADRREDQRPNAQIAKHLKDAHKGAGGLGERRSWLPGLAAGLDDGFSTCGRRFTVMVERAALRSRYCLRPWSRSIWPRMLVSWL